MQNTSLTPELAPLLTTELAPLLTTELAPALAPALEHAPASEQLAVLMKRIELDGMNQVQELKTGQPIQDLIQIMTKGSEEFRNNTGRNMTYSEMREMYG